MSMTIGAGRTQSCQSRAATARVMWVTTALLAALTAAPGCNSNEEGPASSDSSQSLAFSECSNRFSRTFTPVRIDGGHHLTFEMEAFALLLDPSLRIDKIELVTTVREKTKGTPFEVPLAINGLQTFAGDVLGFYQSQIEGENSICRHRLDKLRVAGSEPIDSFLLRMLTNKGQVKLSLQGQNLHVLSAQMLIEGFEPAVCPSPSPTPSGTPSPSPSPTEVVPSPSPSPVLPPVAPVTHLDGVSPEGAIVAATSITFEFSSDQPGASFYCSIDGAPAELCASPQSYSALSDGPHSFRVVATGANGLADPAGVSHDWTVDTLEPVAGTISTLGLPSRTNSTSLTITFDSSDASGFLCSLDGAAYAECASPMTYSGLTEGSHRFQVLSIDEAGNISSVPASFDWVIDLTAPTIELPEVSPAAAVTSSASLSASFSATESATFECAIDDGVFVACTSPYSTPELAEGNHELQIRAIDAAGNVGPALTYAWKIDQTAPLLSTGNLLPAPGIVAASAIAVEFFANEEGRVLCSFDGEALAPCISPFVRNDLGNGRHELRIEAFDAAGNPSAPLLLEWTLDTQSPMLSFTEIAPSAASFINASWLRASIAASEAASLACKLNGSALAATSSPVFLDNLAEGAYSLVIQGQDSAGNLSEPLLHGFTVDLTAPIIEASARIANAATRETSNELMFAANEPSTFECELNSAGFSACSSPLVIGGLADGDHVFKVRAIDQAGNRGSEVEIHWHVDLIPPQTLLNASRTLNTAISFNLSSTEPGSSFLCSLDGAPFSACASTVNFASLSAGPHAFTARAIDAVGNMDPVGATHSWTVDPLVQTLLTSASPSVSPTAQQSASFQFSANVAGATFRCSLDGAPYSACVSPISYAGLADGTHRFAVVASDRYGTPDASGGPSRTWTVDITPPTLVQASAKYANITTRDTSNEFTFAANEPATFECSLNSAAFTSCSSPRVIGGLADGNQVFKIRAIDQAGNRGNEAVIQWHIDLIPPQTSLSASRSLNTAISFNLSSSETGSTFVCSLDGAPFSACASAVNLVSLSTGAHVFTARAIDAVGNMDPVGASHSWTVDPPVQTLLTSASPNLSPTAQQDASFQFSANVAGATFRCSLDGAPFSACVSPISYAGLADGTHRFAVVASDRYGTPDASGGPSRTWTVDTTPPTVLSVSSTQTSTTITITWTTNEASTSKVLWGTGYDTSRTTAEDMNLVTSHTVKLTGLLPNSQYSFIVTGGDAAGNRYTTSRRTVRTNY